MRDGIFGAALERVYDGFLVQSRDAGADPLSEAPQPAIRMPPVALIRRAITDGSQSWKVRQRAIEIVRAAAGEVGDRCVDAQ